MKTEKLNQILKIVEEKVTMDLNGESMDPDPLVAFEWLIGEIDEAVIEYKDGKKIYLEDELCDIVYSIFRIIETLDRSGSADKSRIFDRIIKKYTERVYGLKEGKKWNDIKKLQKAELLEEQTNLENK